MDDVLIKRDGKTAGQWLSPQIEAAYGTGRMPPLLPIGSD